MRDSCIESLPEARTVWTLPALRLQKPVLRPALHVAGGSLHGALGSLVAAGGEWHFLGLHLPETLALGLLVGTALRRGHGSPFRAWLACSAAAFVLIALFARPTSTFLVCYGSSLALIALAQARAESTNDVKARSWWRSLFGGLVMGSLCFLCGASLQREHLGGSIFLLTLGFFGLYAGAIALLESATRATSSLLVASMFTTGSSAVMAWMWIYGPGPSGIALAAPFVLWLLWFVAWWVNPAKRSRRPRRVREMILPWVAIELAVALATTL